MKLGRQTYKIDKNVYITETSSIAGPYEAKGTFKEFFDTVMEEDEWKCKTRELTEIKMQKENVNQLLSKLGMKEKEVGVIMGGDLINQIVPTSFAAREFEIPFMGLYNACATFGEALILGSFLIERGFPSVLCITSSHFATAERQYRFPLELGTQPTPASQWTVTGTGCAMLQPTSKEKKPRITHVTVGKIVDLKCTDPNNMGAAMAPAACDTIVTHFRETGREADYYDVIFTGDLGRFGRDTLHYLCKEEGYELANSLNDCGSLIYSEQQKPGQGGSGAGCCSLVFASYIYKEMAAGNFKKILFVPTGALLSKDSPLQGESIPGIAHAVAIETED